MTKTFSEVISGIRTAKKGVEVREDIAQMGEYVQGFAQTATEKASSAASSAAAAKESRQKAAQAVSNIDQQTASSVAAVQQAQTTATTTITQTKDAALTDIGNARAGALQDVANSTATATAAASAAAGSASAAAESEDASKASEEAAAKSEAAAKASQAAAAASEANALKYSQEAGAKAGTDKTFSIKDAPADAEKTGEELALRYTKEQVDDKLGEKADKSTVQDSNGEALFYSKEEIVNLLIQKLSLSGGAMVGALNLANATWNSSGDDAFFGDINITGAFCVKGRTDSTKLALVDRNDDTNYSYFEYSDGTVKCNKTIDGYGKAFFISGGNANNLTETGIYHSTGSVENSPDASYHGTLFVESNVGTKYQLWIPDAKYCIYKRTMQADGSYGSWVTLVDAASTTALQSAQSDTDSLMVDQEYQLTLLKLGIDDTEETA